RMLHQSTQGSAGAPFIQAQDLVDTQIRAGLDWTSEQWSAGFAVTYQGAYDVDYTTSANQLAKWKVSPVALLDLRLSYDFSDDSGWMRGTSLKLNVDNVLDTDPPPVPLSGSLTSPVGGGYSDKTNPLGR